MRDNQQRLNLTALAAAALSLLVLLLTHPTVARAQWTTSGNNISNTNTGNVGVGTANPEVGLHVATESITTPRGFLIQQSNTGNNSAFMIMRKGRGTIAVPSVIVNGDSLGAIYTEAFDGSTFLRTGASIKFISNGTVAVGSVPTDITFGTGSSGTGTERMRITSAGNVGIGTTNPQSLFQILGASPTAYVSSSVPTLSQRITNSDTTNNSAIALRFSTFDTGGGEQTGAAISGIFTGHATSGVMGELAFQVKNGGTVNEALRINSAGYVGVGTTAPGARLHVNGTTLSGISAGTSGDYNARSLMLTARSLNDGVASLGFDANGAYRGAFDFNGGSGLLAWYTNGGSGWIPTFVVSSGGTVGIGMTGPNSAYKLDVAGSINASGFCLGGTCKSDWSQVGGQWTTSGSNVYYNTGGVGIGTNSPASWRKLHVLGGNVESQWSATAGQGYGFYIARDNNHFAENAYFDGTVWRAIQSGKASIIQTYTSGGYALYVQADNTVRAADAARSFSPVFAVKMDGSLGVGTTTPLQKLQVGSNTAAATTTPDAISLGATYSSAAGANPKLRLYDDNATSVYGLGVSSSQFDFMAPTGARYVWNLNGVEKMRLDSSGNVGIGTTPGASYKLDVNGQAHVSGDMTVDGNIAAKYQDVAEWVPSNQKLQAGTVVVLDTNRTNHVLASTASYDTKVAGVVSGRPGIALGEGGEGKALVATTGRVKVRVDATRGAIHVGDLLVTSDVEGVAMRSEPIEVGGRKIHAPGTIIGKALEPLEKGTGEILVLLSLQ